MTALDQSEIEEAIAPHAKAFALALATLFPAYGLPGSAFANSALNLSAIIDRAISLDNAFGSLLNATANIL